VRRGRRRGWHRAGSLPPSLRDPAAQQDLEQRGYAVFPGFAADRVDWLRALFHELHESLPRRERPASGLAWDGDPAPGAGFDNDLERPFWFRDELERRLAPHWDHLLPQLYVDHRPVVSTYLIKRPGSTSHLPLHQDPTIVDESRHRATTLWIALHDADSDLGNGPLHVLDGSHRVGAEHRGTHTSSTFLRFLGDAWSQTRPLAHRAGDAIVMDARLIHGSPPNDTDRLRLAVCTPVVPAGVPLVHTVGLDEDRVVILPVPDDFYRRTSPGRLNREPPARQAGAKVLRRAPVPFRPELLTT
jgi:hypothetical protein